MVDYGKEIRKARMLKGWTQEQLANAINVQRAVISKYENSQIEPSVSRLKAIAKALDVDDWSTLATEKAIIDDIANNLCGISQHNAEHQLKAESDVDGDYFVYFANFLIENADIISILNQTGIKITVLDQKNVNIQHAYLNERLTTNRCVEKLTQLNKEMSDALYRFDPLRNMKPKED